MSHICITFGGKALDTHEMDARDLAPALLAMADLWEASVAVLHGSKAKARVNVRGSFKSGSFGIDFFATVDFLQAVKDFFNSDTMAATGTAITVLAPLGFAGKKGVAHVLKWLNGRKISSIEEVESGKVTLRVGSEEVTVDKEVVELIKDVPLRKAFDKLLSPLEKEGVDTFAVSSGKDIFFLAEKADRNAFSLPEFLGALQESRFEMTYFVLSPFFKRENKWRLSDGENAIQAKILDAAFWEKIESRQIAFGQGDTLRCRVLVRQRKTESGVKTEYEVEEVVEYSRGMRQMDIFNHPQE